MSWSPLNLSFSDPNPRVVFQHNVGGCLQSETPQCQRKAKAGSKKEGVGSTSARKPSHLPTLFPGPHCHVGGRTAEKEVPAPLLCRENWPWAPESTMSMEPRVKVGKGAGCPPVHGARQMLNSHLSNDGGPLPGAREDGRFLPLEPRERREAPTPYPVCSRCSVNTYWTHDSSPTQDPWGLDHSFSFSCSPGY